MLIKELTENQGIPSKINTKALLVIIIIETVPFKESKKLGKPKFCSNKEREKPI